MAELPTVKIISRIRTMTVFIFMWLLSDFRLWFSNKGTSISEPLAVSSEQPLQALTAHCLRLLLLLTFLRAFSQLG